MGVVDVLVTLLSTTIFLFILIVLYAIFDTFVLNGGVLPEWAKMHGRAGRPCNNWAFKNTCADPELACKVVKGTDVQHCVYPEMQSVFCPEFDGRGDVPHCSTFNMKLRELRERLDSINELSTEATPRMWKDHLMGLLNSRYRSCYVTSRTGHAAGRYKPLYECKVAQKHVEDALAHLSRYVDTGLFLEIQAEVNNLFAEYPV